jgi:putative heme-binding domain-containing protein
MGVNEMLGLALVELIDDPEITVRFQAALSLGLWNDPRAGRALGRLALKDWSDPWVRAAVLSSVTRQTAPILAAVTAPTADPRARAALIEPLIATLTAPGSDASTRAGAIATITAPGPAGAIEPWRIAALAELVETGRGIDTLSAQRFHLLIAAARALARDATAAPPDRAAATRLLGRDPADRDGDRALLGELVEPGHPAAVQSAAVRALARLREPRAAAELLRRWPRLGPALRAELLDALLARPDSAATVLAAVERGDLAPAEIDAAHRQRLIHHEDEPVRRRATSLLSAVQPRARAEVLATFRPALMVPGERARGAVVFGKVCANCHAFAGRGHEVGPDLAALTDTSPEALLTAILDPNREVDARYANYTAALTDGRVLTGLVAAETGNAITLKRQEGQLDVILRANLDALKTSGQSLMPEGLENDLRPADLADLIAYIASGGAAQPRTLAGNHPETVEQAADGSIRLAAETASVFGPALAFEPEHKDLAGWTSPDDRAAWTFRVARPGTFTVTMDWACPDNLAGGTFSVRAGPKTIQGTVGGTGAGDAAWSHYQSIFLDEAALPAGTHRLEFRPTRTTRHALLKLRAIVFTPRTFGEAPKSASPP